MARFFLVSLLLSSLATFGAASVVVQDKPVYKINNPLSDKWKWADCGNPTDPVHIKDISVSPDPPKAGEDLTVTVIGETDAVVHEGAYADVSVKVGAIKILQKEFDLCEEARNANLTVQCPIEEGTYEVEHTVALPKEIPPAPFKVEIHGYDVEDEDLLCLILTIDFRKKFPRLW